ncbi:MAG TPA: PaaI family thioesterase [Albitalea sp.]
MNQPAPVDRIPFLKLLGLQQEDAPPGASRLYLPLREELHNMLAAAHGGVLMTLLDVAMARAAISHPQAASGTVVTVEMSSRFLKPGLGDALSAEGRVVSSGRSLCTCEAHVRDAEGALVASAMGTFKYWRGTGGGAD